MNKVVGPDDCIYVAGHRGMVGSAILRRLKLAGHKNLLTRTRDELDLTRQTDVERFFHDERPDYVVLAAARVGGIQANNTRPADFIYENLAIQNNIIHAAHDAGVNDLLFLGSSCIYPRKAPQPMNESALLTGALEATNEPYAVAKIAGIKLCESFNRQYDTDYRCVMPTNLYGPGDNFDHEASHVVPALMRRFHEAASDGVREVTVWGSGRPFREFLHVDDLADACLHIMQIPQAKLAARTRPMQSHINIGTGAEIRIADLARMIARVIGFDGEIRFDAAKPDGTPRKLLDVSLLDSLGWRARIDLEDGLRETYRWFTEHKGALRGGA